MKKILFLLLPILFFGCSDDSNSSTNNNPIESDTINPPAWVQGTWLMETMGLGLKFTTDDVCMVNGSTYVCNKENVINFPQAGGHSNVEETITDDSYTVDVTINSVVNHYRVTRVSATQIKWYLDPSAPTILNKQ